MALRELSRDWILRVMRHYGITASAAGSVTENREAVDRWFREHRPRQPRTDRGTLIIPLRFKTVKPVLGDCDKCELVMIARSYGGMVGPQFNSSRTREELYKAIRAHFMQQYTGLQLVRNDIPFIPVNNTTSRNNPGQPNREFSF